MIPEFPRVTYAIHKVVDYYKATRISDHFKHFDKKQRLGYLDSYIEDTYLAFKAMEKEIQQTIHTSSQSVQDELLYMLKNWQLGFKEVNVKYIEIQIEGYNEHEYKQYVEMIERQELAFKEHVDYSKPHEKKTTVEDALSHWMVLFMEDKPIPPKEKSNSYFYCNTEEPEYIKDKYLPDYIQLIEPIIKEVKNILDKYVARMENRAFSAVSQPMVTHAKPQIEDSKPKKIESSPSLPKMKVNISVPQLAYLFYMLNELKPNLFDLKTKTELYEFVTDNFVTKATQDAGISFDSFKNAFTNPDKKTVDYWIEKLKKMLEDSRKIFS